MMRTGVMALGVAMALGAAGAAWGAVTVKQVRFEGWPNCYQLSNGTVEVVIVPQIGRIMRYGYVGDKNMIWVNPAMKGKLADPAQAAKEWPNFGGDKLWPAPQSRWDWPPDATLDSAPQTVEILPNQHLKMTGQASAISGLRFTREIALDETGTGVTLTNTMTNTIDKAIHWGVWEITQVDDPDVVRLPLNRGGKFAAGYYTFKDSDPPSGRLTLVGDEAHLKRDKEKSVKIGVDSPQGWIRSEKGGRIFEVSAAYETGKKYPDDGCGQEVYTNPDPLKYIEMELLGPMQTLAPGASCSFTTHWRLSR